MSKCVINDVYDLIKRGHSDESIRMITGYEIKWIRDLRERMKNNKIDTSTNED